MRELPQGDQVAETVQSVDGKTGAVVLSEYLQHDGSTNYTGLVLRYSGALLNVVANTADGADTGRTALCGGGGLGISRGGYVAAYGNEHATLPGQINFFAGSGFDAVVSAATFRPAGDNTTTLGAASFRCSVVYAATGTINTSDAREKTPIRPLTEAELAAGAALGELIGAYKWTEMVCAKGDEARLHIGLTVQGAISVMTAHGLDAFAYGFICYDAWQELPEVREEWEALPQVVDDFGNIVQEQREAGFEILRAHRPAGDRYSFRMDELLAFVLAGERAARLAALANIEARLAAAERALGLGA